MSTLISNQTGNFTTAGTWSLVDATSFLNSETANTTLTTSYVASSSFTPGAITVDGVALKLANRTGTTGTISVHLAIAGVEVTGTLVAINCSDLPAAVTANVDGGWVFFKFAAPVLLVVATAYTVEAKTSSATQVVLFRDSTAGNWSRALRTTTTQAPVAGDDLIVTGEYTGAGTSNAFVVTMNETATTDYGSNTTSLVTPALAICSKGTLQYGTAGSTNYYLKLSGNAIVYAGGALNIGTTGTTMPSTSSAVLEFDPAADGDMGLICRNLSTLSLQGNPITSIQTRLAADVSAAGTTLTIGDTTGWEAGKDIAIAPTTRTITDFQKVAITSVDSSTGVTVPSITVAHSGTSPTQAEVIYLYRNVRIRSATSTIMAYVNFIQATQAVDIDYAEFYYIGTNTTNKKGIEIAATCTAGSISIQYASIHDSEAGGFTCAVTSGLNGTFSNNNLYNCNTLAANVPPVSIVATSSTHTLDSNWAVGCAQASGGYIFSFSDAGSTYTNNVVAGSTGNARGYNYTENSTPDTAGTFSGNIAHSMGGTGFIVGATESQQRTLTNCTSWRNGISGFSTSSPMTCNSCTAFGNATDNFNSASDLVVLNNCVAYSQASFTSTNDINCVGSGFVYALNCSLSDTGVGGRTASTQNVNITGTTRCILNNCVLGSTTEATVVAGYGSVQSHKNDQSSTTFKSYYYAGTITNDSTTRHTASGYSWKLTPALTTYKLVLPGPSKFDTFKTPVAASALVTVTIWVQKDGSYNGNAPRLVLVGGIVGGVGSAGTDVTASMAGGSGAWEQLSVSATPNEAGEVEWYLDCDGTAGNVYVDDAAITQAGPYIDTSLMDLVSRALPAQHIAPIPAGGSVPRIGSALIGAST